ncbi:MAG: LPS export ABC transporter periplasmic protein LptC [Bryobacteraceae bacterium]
MRGTRWLVLVAIAAILGGVGLTYRAQKKVLREQAPPQPAALPAEVNSWAKDYYFWDTDTKTNRVIAQIQAENFRQVKDSDHLDLKNVTITIPNKDDATNDVVKSPAAEFFSADHHLYSEGEVEITLRVPKEGPPTRTPVSIKSSGVNFDSDTYRATTDRPSTFIFQDGNGHSTGATYDPTTHELNLNSDVEVDWNPPGPNAKPIKIETQHLSYHEAASQIWLNPWGRLTRENTVVEGNDVTVYLQDDAAGHKIIRKIETTHAHGTDDYPNRKLAYSADYLLVDFDDDGAVRKITGSTAARLVSTSEASETTVTADRVEMDFESQNKQSLLSHVTALGHGLVNSKPLPAPGRPLGETHTLRSENIEMKMRPGGREIETVVTHAPGVLEFLPNQPADHHRTLNGNDLYIAYGPQNRIEQFRARDVTTRTEPTAEERQRNRTLSVTTSRELLAHFDPRTSRLASMEQTGDFTYDEGGRHARAAKATLDSGQNVIVLETSARVWDETGSTSANRIRMDQRTGDFTAEGQVKSSRLPDQDQKKNSQMLSGDQPIEAQARKMDSSNHNRVIHYEGDVAMRQGANRIQAGVIDVNREKRTLVADGNVVTNLWEEPQGDEKTSAAPVLTVVHASHLVYTEENRLAVYTGGVLLRRPGLQVKSKELRAYLAGAPSGPGADSRLDKAFADGAVEIVETAPDRTRTGTGEHAEYYTDVQKVVLRGGRPKLVDSVKGSMQGDELTYFANDGRLLGSGSPQQPITSRIRRKK